MSARVRFSTFDPEAREAAEQASLAGASALGTALWAYLSVAASGPGVLLSPVSILLFGFGARRAFDGRLRQPGLGTGRPRGFREGDPIPEAARVAIPRSLAAVFVAFSYDEHSVQSQALTAAIRAAKREGAAKRALVFEQARGFGAAAFRESGLPRALVDVAGPAQGGLVTIQDFADAEDVDVAARSDEESRTLRLPWGEQPTSEPTAATQCVLTADRRGTMVAVLYERTSTGLPIFDGELLAPARAVPVMRGITRLAPGQPLEQSCDAEVELDASGVAQTTQCAGLGLRVTPP